MSWHTVPDFFPDYEDLDKETLYHLYEGFCISGYKTKKSGKHYKKVKMEGNGNFHSLLSYMGFYGWHEKWKLKHTLFGRKWVKR